MERWKARVFNFDRSDRSVSRAAVKPWIYATAIKLLQASISRLAVVVFALRPSERGDGWRTISPAGLRAISFSFARERRDRIARARARAREDEQRERERERCSRRTKTNVQEAHGRKTGRATYTRAIRGREARSRVGSPTGSKRNFCMATECQ